MPGRCPLWQSTLAAAWPTFVRDFDTSPKQFWEKAWQFVWREQANRLVAHKNERPARAGRQRLRGNDGYKQIDYRRSQVSERLACDANLIGRLPPWGPRGDRAGQAPGIAGEESRVLASSGIHLHAGRVGIRRSSPLTWLLSVADGGCGFLAAWAQGWGMQMPG